jgi:hypothetical protein
MADTPQTGKAKSGKRMQEGKGAAGATPKSTGGGTRKAGGAKTGGTRGGAGNAGK